MSGYYVGTWQGSNVRQCDWCGSATLSGSCTCVYGAHPDEPVELFFGQLQRERMSVPAGDPWADAVEVPY